MIKLQNVGASKNGRVIHENINIECQQGNFTVIAGESGCGKTTLLNIIGLIEDEFTGKRFINNQDVTKLNTKQKQKFYQNEISFIFQNFGLLENETVYDNLLIALKHQQIKKEVKKDKMHKLLMKLDLNVELTSKIYELSGGEQQRIALARAILKDSDILLCDEPTGSLDSKNSEIVIKILKELANIGKTILVVSHDEEVIKCADVKYVLK